MPPKSKIKAMFDIVPVINRDELVGPEKLSPNPAEPLEEPPMFGGKTSKHGQDGLDSLISRILEGNISPKEEIEALMSDVSDPVVELASIGAKFPSQQLNLSRLNLDSMEVKLPYIENKEEFYNKIVAQIREPVSPLETQTKLAKPRGMIAGEVVSFYQNISKTSLPNTRGTLAQKKPTVNIVKSKSLNFHTLSKKRRTGWWLTLLIVIGIIAYGFTLKNELLKGGISAFNNLEEAGESLKSFNFSKASENFGKSYQDFSRASQTMNFMGAGLAGIFSDLPGAGKLKSAKDMAEAGKLIARSGQAMSQAMESLSHIGSILNPGDKNKIKPLKIINSLKDALLLSNNNFQKAKALIADVDGSIIPEDKRANFDDFKDKLPLLEEYLGNAIEYTEFLGAIVGIDEPKKYLLLFNNYSELRPTGGFPGTYGVVSFSGGGLADFFVDDVYNLDGQLTKNIIPPKQLQHITPNWGMRDASWFFDFPTSAKKTMSFFSEEAGYKVDGVIALNPDIVSGILAVVGPVNMPEYGMTLRADNFLESIQEEVEYGENRVQPKKVVVDFAPRFLEKLYSADSEKWMRVFNILMAGLEEKDILFYFEDKESENFAIKEGFGGEVKKTAGDYLAVNFSNIKGSKTDAMTDSSVSIDTRFEADRVVHKVILARNHKGGDHEHGFYNRQNPAYVRVLVPEDAELLNISGNDLPNFRPIINYGLQGGFEKDRNLAIFESGFYTDKFPGVDKFKESGKKGIGFWMITEPGTAKKIEFEYSVPLSRGEAPGNEYTFYFQKQPGLDWKNFSFKTNGMESYKIVETAPTFNRIGDLYMLDTELKKDLEIKIKFK